MGARAVASSRGMGASSLPTTSSSLSLSASSRCARIVDLVCALDSVEVAKMEMKGGDRGTESDSVGRQGTQNAYVRTFTPNTAQPNKTRMLKHEGNSLNRRL